MDVISDTIAGLAVRRFADYAAEMSLLSKAGDYNSIWQSAEEIKWK